jgi:uncharacterized membrane protein YcaP (DUF421 family)
MVTEEELISQIRDAGIESPSAVKSATLESDGLVSVIPYTTDGLK